jgi:hypothetical protein
MRAPVIAAAIVLASVATASATPAEDYDRARQLFLQHDWQSAIPLLGSVLYPQPLLGESNKVFEAHVILGACEFETGDKPTAHDEFEKALLLDSERTLSALTFSEGAIELFDETKAEVKRRAADEAARTLKAEANEKLQAYLKSLVVVEHHQFALNFVPFGAGQYQNGDYKKFYALSAAEFATAATSIAIFGYLVNKYGISGTVNPKLDDPHTVRLLQQVEIGSGAAFFALYAYGVFDAIRHYKPQTRLDSDPSILPPDLRSIDPNAPPPSKPPPKAIKTSFHFGPVLVPSGAGVGLSWER